MRIIRKLFRLSSRKFVYLINAFQFIFFKYGIEIDNIKIKLKINNVDLWQSINSPRSFARASVEIMIEKELIDLIDELDPDDIFIDIGANVGVYSCYAAKKGIFVIAFEPSFPNSYLFSRNIEINQISEYVMNFKLALSNHSGISTLLHHKTISAGNSGASIIGDNFYGESFMPITFRETCLVDTLDRVMANLDLSPSLIKIDTDGSEMSILEGANLTLTNPVLKKVLIEASSHVERNILESYLKDYNFSLNNIISKSLTTPEICNLIFERRN